MDLELAVIVPTLGRPSALKLLVERFAEVTPTSHRVIFVVDSDDQPTWDVMPAITSEHPEVAALEHSGTYPIKVNAGIRATTEPLILVGADDIKPHPGWLEEAKKHLTDEVGFVSLNDLGNHSVMRGDYATLPLVARWYVDLEVEAEGSFYFEGYHHNYCDADASYRAKHRGAFAYAPKAIMEHLHPAWGKAPSDATYERGGLNATALPADEELLRKRSAAWA